MTSAGNWQSIHVAAVMLDMSPAEAFSMARRENAARHVPAGRFGRWEIEVDELRKVVVDKVSDEIVDDLGAAR